VFRRKVPLLGRFIADFLAPVQRLVVEVDGGYHLQRLRADAARDGVLVHAGCRVLRFEARLVDEIEAVVRVFLLKSDGWACNRRGRLTAPVVVVRNECASLTRDHYGPPHNGP